MTAIACVLTICLASVLVSFVQANCRFNQLTWSNYLNVSETILSSFLATTNRRRPQSLQMRFVFGLWFLGCVFITAHIQTSFIANLTKPGYNTEIQDQNELLKSNLNITIGRAHISFLKRTAVGRELLKVKDNETTTMGLFKTAKKMVKVLLN